MLRIKTNDKFRLSLNISIKNRSGGIYDSTPLGAKIMSVFGNPGGHGVGMGEEDFIYGIAEKDAMIALKVARKIVGRKGSVTLG